MLVQHSATPQLTSFAAWLPRQVPLLERKADKRWGDVLAYQQYKRRTSVLVPVPPSVYAACASRLLGRTKSAERAGAGL